MNRKKRRGIRRTGCEFLFEPHYVVPLSAFISRLSANAKLSEGKSPMQAFALHVRQRNAGIDRVLTPCLFRISSKTEYSLFPIPPDVKEESTYTDSSAFHW